MRAVFRWLLYVVLPALTSCRAVEVERRRPPPRCRTSISVTLAEAGLGQLSARIPHGELADMRAIARAQADDFGGTVCFSTALALAARSLLADASDLESPGAVLAGRCVRCAIDHPRARLRLVARGDPLPERGESLERNWVFSLSLPHVSDHVFWAIVARTRSPRGEVRVYNYGFN